MHQERQVQQEDAVTCVRQKKVEPVNNVAVCVALTFATNIRKNPLFANVTSNEKSSIINYIRQNITDDYNN
jgi:hypothetical protein